METLGICDKIFSKYAHFPHPQFQKSTKLILGQASKAGRVVEQQF
jgi:hypothetical protein